MNLPLDSFILEIASKWSQLVWDLKALYYEPYLLLLGFNSSLPQLVWDLKALLLLLLLLASGASCLRYEKNAYSFPFGERQASSHQDNFL